MFFRRYILTCIKFLLSSAIILIGFFSFGQPLVFDRISVVSFILIALLLRKDQNIVGVCILLVLDNLVINGLYEVTTNSFVWTIIGYLATLFALWYTRFDPLSKPLAVFTLLSIALEVYWYFEQINNAQTYFYFMKISVFLIVRQLLMIRHDTSRYYFDSDTTNIRLDWYIYKIKALAILFTVFVIVEYQLILTTSHSTLYIYAPYQYAMHGMSVWVIWLIVREAISLLKNRTLPA